MKKMKIGIVHFIGKPSPEYIEEFLITWSNYLKSKIEFITAEDAIAPTVRFRYL